MFREMKARSKGKVLLVNPNRMQPPVAPIALDYLASSLGLSGYEVDLLDLCFSADVALDIKNYFSQNSVVAVAFTIRNTDDASLATQAFFIPEYKGVIDFLRSHTDAPIILGGSGFSIMPQAMLDYCGLDMGIWGEGEYALPLLVDRVVTGDDYRGVTGLVYRVGRDFKTNPPKYFNLESIAAPRRDMADNRRYFSEGGMGNIETKRGCAKRCIYCADPLGKGTKVRCRSPKSVADEVEGLLAMGIDCLHFCDSEFNLPPGHAMSVCHELVGRGLGSKMRWYAYCSPVLFDDEIASAFQRAGCAGINFGVDSSDDAMLRRLRRDFCVGDLLTTADVCRRHDIVFMYDLLLGGPGESRDSLRATIETMKRLSPSRVGASLGVRIYPGTGMADIVRNQGPIETNPNLHGVVDETLFAPVFYLESALGNDASQYLTDLIASDERFFFMSGDVADRNYNYNDNALLVDAIKKGYRGAFWDILRRLSAEPT